MRIWMLFASFALLIPAIPAQAAEPALKARPATVTLTLSGEGNLQGVPSPQLPEQPGLTVLAPQQLPVGVLTSLIGVPVFLFQLHQLHLRAR